MKNLITTLEELQAEKENLKMTMEMTRHEFAQSIGTNKMQLKSYVLKNVALPVGALGAAAAGYKMMTSPSGKKSSGEKTSNGNLLFNKLIPIGINLFSAYFMKKKADEAVDQPTVMKVASDKKVMAPVGQELENIGV